MLIVERNTLPLDKTVSASLDRLAFFRKSPLQSQEKRSIVKLDLAGIDFSQVLVSTLETLELYGNYNYRLGVSDNGTDRVDPGYAGIGLTYNPDHSERNDCNVHQQVQGNFKPAKERENPFSVLTPEEGRKYATKNSHYDTYGLCYRTPASKHGYLGQFLDTCSRTMVRSAVRIINSEATGPANVNGEKRAGVTWHRDESMFENLRVNIPLITNPNFVLEQEGTPPVHLAAGSAYSWDTNILHRAYALEQTAEPFSRIHLMLGFSCWWDFNEETGKWSQNEFFGKKHPKDMLIDGDVIPGLKLDLDFS
jgi:hypothetical protein